VPRGRSHASRGGMPLVRSRSAVLWMAAAIVAAPAAAHAQSAGNVNERYLRLLAEKRRSGR
jgi:hypothetical protein